MPIFDRRAVVAQLSETLGKITVARRDRAAVTQRAQVLPGIKTEACRVPEASRARAPITRAMRPRGVLDDAKMMSLRARVRQLNA